MDGKWDKKRKQGSRVAGRHHVTGKLLRAAPGRAWDREQLGYRALTETESEDPMGAGSPGLVVAMKGK